MKTNKRLYMMISIGILLAIFVIMPGSHLKVQAGDGAEVTEIYTVEDLDHIRNDLSGHYLLMNDIDLAGVEWTPIGECVDGTSDHRDPCEITDERFSGVFDGQGHVINNMTITMYGKDNTGFFSATTSESEIKNLGVTNVSIDTEGDRSNVGGLVGMNEGVIVNAYTTGTVNRADHYVGGLVGYNDTRGEVTSSWSSVNVTGEKFVGGLIGYNNGTISNSYATGEVKASDNESLFSYAGGLIGSNYGSVSNVYAAGDVTATGESAGGLIGTNSEPVSIAYATGDVKGVLAGGLIGTNNKAYVSNVYATGRVEGAQAGGLIGSNFQGHVSHSYAVGEVSANGLTAALAVNIGKISFSYWNRETSGVNVGAYHTRDDLNITEQVVGLESAAELKMQSNFEHLDFVDTWTMIDGESYPRLISDFAANRLSDLMVGDANETAFAMWDTDFDQGIHSYTVAFDQAVEQVSIEALPIDSGAEVWIDGKKIEGSITEIVGPGDNLFTFDVYSDQTEFVGRYEVVIKVPSKITQLIAPEDGYYGNGDLLAFTVIYDAPVIVEGNPTLPITIDGDTYMASYKEQLEAYKLQFEYVIEEGISDSNGIEVEMIRLPEHASIKANGMDASLFLPAADTSGIYVDSISPTIDIVMKTADGNPYMDNTWSNQAVTVTASAYDEQRIASVVYSSDGGKTWSPYNFQIGLNDDGVYPLYLKAVDTAGNETMEQRTVKISSSGLKLTPTLQLANGSPYSSGDWTNMSVTASVYAEAGISGIDYITYTLNNKASQPYGNEDPITISTEGLTILKFEVADQAGNTFLSTYEIHIDKSAPTVIFGTNGSESWSASAASKVNVSDDGSGLDPTTLTYTWSTNTTTPATGWTALVDGEILTKSGEEGDWYLHIKASDRAGNTVVTHSNRFRLHTSSDSVDDNDDDNNDNDKDDISSSPVTTELTINLDDGIIIHVDPSMIEKVTLEDGTVREDVALSEEILDEWIEHLAVVKRPYITIKIDDTEQAVQVQFPAHSLERITKIYPDAVLEVRLNGSSIQMQGNALDLQELSGQLGVGMENMKVNLTIAQVVGVKYEKWEQVATSYGLKLIGSGVDYKMSVSSGKQLIEIDDFNSPYMASSITLVEDEIANHTITAMWYNPSTQSLHFAPSVLVTREDAQPEMVIRVVHNSIYAVMASEGRTFSDLDGHWAKNEIERLASKLIVFGVSNDRFAPDAAITRAEFTELLVRSLGMVTDNRSAGSQFTDVDSDDWYAPSVDIAVKSGIVQGVDAKHFAPDDKITREQMAVMVAQAIQLTGTPISEVDENTVLGKFADRESISIWANDSLAQTVNAGIINGTPDHKLAPQDFATRAQAVVMLIEFLEYVDFID